MKGSTAERGLAMERKPLGQHLRKQGKRLAVLVMCMTFLLSLFGCKLRPHGGDTQTEGQGGKTPSEPWVQMDLTRSDSDFSYSFYFTAVRTDTCYVVSGECADDEGYRHETEEGVEVPLEVLDAFDLNRLSEASEDRSFLDMMVMDAATIRLTLTYADGTQVKKAIGESLSLEIYQALLPYFATLEPQ